MTTVCPLYGFLYFKTYRAFHFAPENKILVEGHVAHEASPSVTVHIPFRVFLPAIYIIWAPFQRTFVSAWMFLDVTIVIVLAKTFSLSRAIHVVI
jgi:hypothetical protein